MPAGPPATLTASPLAAVLENDCGLLVIHYGCDIELADVVPFRSPSVDGRRIVAFQHDKAVASLNSSS